jgi:hypothetical protein
MYPRISSKLVQVSYLKYAALLTGSVNYFAEENYLLRLSHSCSVYCNVDLILSTEEMKPSADETELVATKALHNEASVSHVRWRNGKLEGCCSCLLVWCSRGQNSLI